jgi:threonyl-tRNA synthetase
VLWERSGHWEKFRENMFLIPEEDHTFAIKPMNCPGHMVLFANTLRSYRELPLRYAEAAPLHRNEPSGTLHGLTRVRHVTQDDAHIFCTREQIEDEIFGCLDYAKFIYDLFDLEAGFELSTRPENRLGTDEEWDFTEGALQAALDRRGLEYSINEGDGAFYGPKIDLHMKDSLGRAWQMGTIQLDSQQPGRLNCRYVGTDNAEHVPYVVHRALMGSFERFIGILTEHYAGAFPFWIAPVQIRIVPVGEGNREAAEALAEKLAPYRIEVDASDDTVGKRIRNAEVAKIPYVVVYGAKESDDSLAIREHGGEQTTLSLGDLRAKLATLNPWQAGAEPSLTS